MARSAFDAKRKIGIDLNHTNKEYTPESCVVELLKLVPYEKDDFVLDCSAGFNKVWFNNIDANKDYCELDEGKDFLEYNESVDWVVGNPPFTHFVKFMIHSGTICNKGFGFLINHSRLNQVTPKRLDDLKEKGFYLNKIHIFGVGKWFGRYYFLLFTKEKGTISYTRKTFT